MLSLALFAPLVGAALVLLLPARRERLVRGAAAFCALIPLVIVVIACARFNWRLPNASLLSGNNFQQVERAAWIPSLGASYVVGIDGISLPLLAMTALLFLAAIVYPVDYKGRAKSYFALFLFLESVSLGVFLALDLLLFYVFWDLSLVGMYFLIGVWGHGEDARRAALKFFLYTFAGSLAMLLSILVFYLHSGADGSGRTFDFALLIARHPLDGAGLAATLTFVGFAIGFAIKTPLVPFHTWLPPAHVDAPATASAILAGVLLKMGTYGFVRILLSMMPITFQRFAFPLGVIALISIIYGALVSMAQPNLKRRIAYTSINHMGYAIMGIAAAGGLLSGAEEARRLALTGATVEMVAHGLITGALFLMTGSIWQRAGTYEIADFGGLARRAPALTGLMAVASFASLGLPGLAGFVAEFEIFVGTYAVFPWLAALALFGIIITAALFLHMLQRVFLGNMNQRWSAWPDLGPIELTVLATLLALVLAIGVAPAPLLTIIDTGVRSILGNK